MAARYLDVRQTKGAAPVPAMAEENGASDDNRARWIKEARGRGLLTSEGAARAGGMLTRKAANVLASISNAD